MDEPPDIHTVLCSLGLVNEQMGYDETCSDVAQDDDGLVGGESSNECDALSAPLSERGLSPVSVDHVHRTPPAGRISLGTNPNIFASKNLIIFGTLVGTMQDTAAALEYARRGQLESVSELRGLRAMPESVQQWRRGEIAGRLVIDLNKE
ncbi:hypothetical protein B0A48_18848 [Cryoendolithus antarcticus]|uniref:Alcohol dehydrogenase-like C-terminal domain-containing protein n=1 Tax=Cryoendolithus antarcticus TaxID=1507870 RepID=A0A1V8S742_9PEZI|nr:hypothetical protein B0A48_18848 [Cryoendolithus antarcticus]